ncbi:MAG: DNA-directed RNA polymerase subunit P [Candidatus Thermoplasmatota archaeon]
MNYKCARCKTRIRDINTVGIQCTVCGSKVFYRERANVKKSIKAR